MVFSPHTNCFCASCPSDQIYPSSVWEVFPQWNVKFMCSQPTHCTLYKMPLLLVKSYKMCSSIVLRSMNLWDVSLSVSLNFKIQCIGCIWPGQECGKSVFFYSSIVFSWYLLYFVGFTERSHRGGSDQLPDPV